MNKALFFAVLLAFAAAQYNVAGKFKLTSSTMKNDFGEKTDWEFDLNKDYVFDAKTKEELAAYPYGIKETDLQKTHSLMKGGDKQIILTASEPDKDSKKPATVKMIVANPDCEDITTDIANKCKADIGCKPNADNTKCTYADIVQVKPCTDASRSDKGKCENDNPNCVWDTLITAELKCADKVGDDACKLIVKDYLCGEKVNQVCKWDTTNVCKHRTCDKITDQDLCPKDKSCRWVAEAGTGADKVKAHCEVTVCAAYNSDERKCKSYPGDCAWTAAVTTVGSEANSKCENVTPTRREVEAEEEAFAYQGYKRSIDTVYKLDCAFDDVEKDKSVTLTCENSDTPKKKLVFTVVNSASSVFASFALIAVALLFALF